MKQDSKSLKDDRTNEGSAAAPARVGRYDATVRSAETVAASNQAQPAPAFEPPDHAV